MGLIITRTWGRERSGLASNRLYNDRSNDDSPASSGLAREAIILNRFLRSWAELPSESKGGV